MHRQHGVVCFACNSADLSVTAEPTCIQPRLQHTILDEHKICKMVHASSVLEFVAFHADKTTLQEPRPLIIVLVHLVVGPQVWSQALLGDRCFLYRQLWVLEDLQLDGLSL